MIYLYEKDIRRYRDLRVVPDPDPNQEGEMDLIKLPKVFFEDHRSRELPTPEIVKATKTHYFVSAEDPALDELLSDAEYYADPYGPSGYDGDLGLRSSARATARAINRAREGR